MMGEGIGDKIFELALQFSTFKFSRFAYFSLKQRIFFLVWLLYQK